MTALYRDRGNDGDKALANGADEAKLDEALDDDEEAREEEESIPLDGVHERSDAVAVNEKSGGKEHEDDVKVGIDARHRGQEEREHEAEEERSHVEQRDLVNDGVGLRGR